MKIKYYKGALAGGLMGALVWLASAFMDLPAFVFYLAQLWLVRPMVRAFEIGSTGALVTMLLVCVISFAIYGVLFNMLFDRIRSLRK